MGLGDLARKSASDQRKAIEQNVYHAIEDYLNNGRIGQTGVIHFATGVEYKIGLLEVMPDIATELKEGGFYVHVIDEYYTEDIYRYTGGYGSIAFEFKIDNNEANSIRPSGRKISSSMQ